MKVWLFRQFSSPRARNPYSPPSLQHCAEHENSVRGLFNRSSFKISVTHKWNYSTGEENPPSPSPLFLAPLPSPPPPSPSPPFEGDGPDSSWSGSRWIENIIFGIYEEGMIALIFDWLFLVKWNFGSSIFFFENDSFYWMNLLIVRCFDAKLFLCRDKTYVTCRDTSIT